jgi:hypothetical protein
MILYKNNMLGSSFWLNSGNLSFDEIQKQSFISEKWLNKDETFYNKIIQPVNRYVSLFGNYPEIINKKDFLILRQKTHAEIWIEKINDVLYAVDKVQQRQFYPSSKNMFDTKCFIPTFKFYIPWIIDKNISCEIKSVEESIFSIENNTINFKENDNNVKWINFLFKINDFFIKNKYFIIPIGEPMFDIIIKDKTVIKEILNEHK